MSRQSTRATRTNLLKRAWFRLVVDPTLGVQTLLVLICVAAAIFLPVFLRAGNLSNLIGSSAVIIVLSIGMTVVLISGGLDLSIGANMALTAGSAATAMLSGLPVFGAILVAVAVGSIVGLGNGLLVTKLGLPDFIATLAMGGFATGILYIWTQGVPIIGYMVPEFYIIGGTQAVLGPITVPMLIALCVALVAGWLVGYTRFGMRLFAVGSNPEGASHSGVNVPVTRVSAYVFSGVTAGIAGVVMAGRNTNVPPNLGVGYEIEAIAAAVIGGAALTGGQGRILGAVLGAITLGTAVNLINLAGVPSSYQTIVIGSMLLLAVLANRASSSINRHFRRRRDLEIGLVRT